MFRALNKVSGALFGIILYPIKSLLINLFLAALIVLTASILLVGLPLLFAYVAYSKAEMGSKLSSAIITGSLVGIIALVIIPPLTITTLIGAAVTTVKDIFSSIRLGATEGYAEGLIPHVLKQFLTGFVPFSRTLQTTAAVLHRIANGGGAEALNEEGLNELTDIDDIDYSQFEDVPRSTNEVPSELTDNTEVTSNTTTTPNAFTPLSAEELQKAREISDLGDSLSQYEDLHKRLTALNEAIKKERIEGMLDDSLIADELTHLEIEKPSLLIKLYEYEPNKWKPVKGTTKIIDYKNLKEWLQLHNSHPETREPMNDATPYQGHKTKYRIFPYNELKDSHELRELTALIRHRLKELNPENLPSAPALFSGLTGTIGQTFFGNSANAATIPPAHTVDDTLRQTFN
ncbi:hypothetical protein [Legionella cardiaca]|uniref:Coiled coil protein n=1 Tax=Legionella cardiaca TaxID=1071983 RepID=A0ABY8AME0_9GAMM|nr:hypothetical protein [Legionella cardiaca]WED41853.1 hypothetical protein PXX05_07865 [Legionella cardiaca]